MTIDPPAGPSLLMKNRSTAVCVVASISVLASSIATAQTITVSPNDRQLSLSLVLEGKGASVSRYVTVTSNAAVPRLALDPTDLISSSHGVIDRSNVRLALGAALPAVIPTNVLVSIGGTAKPGVYSGSFLLRPSTSAAGETIKVTLDAELKPNLSFLPTAPSLNAISCTFGWSCRIGELMPGYSEPQSVGLNNGTPAPGKIQISEKAAIRPGGAPLVRK